MSPFRLARRAGRMNPSIIREILKTTERPGIVSLAGGLPPPELFPVEALREAAARVLRDQPGEALQYAASEGFGPLREWIAADVRASGIPATADQVIVTTGSQQGLDLIAKVLIDAGSTVLVESPTYLGALQAFGPFEPRIVPIDVDEEGPRPLPTDVADATNGVPAPGRAPAEQARFLYLIPNFQNPSGRSIGAHRRAVLAAATQAGGPPIVEDDPYGDLWYDEPPPPPIAAHAPEHVIHLGSLSKILSPGLRLGYLIAPAALHPKLLQAKQAADLHTSGLTQRIAAHVLTGGLLDAHLPAIRRHYRIRRDAMHAALTRHLGGEADWEKPAGGMFFWIRLNRSIDTLAMLPAALAEGVAYVPGAAFMVAADRSAEAAATTEPATAEPVATEPEKAAPPCAMLRLSFVTAAPVAIDAAIATLAGVIRRQPGLSVTAMPEARRRPAVAGRR